MTTLEIDPCYCGPDDVAHGGYLCGRLAGLTEPQAGSLPVVTLLEPVPLASPLEFQADDGRSPAGGQGGSSPHASSLWDGDRLLASVTRKPASIPPVGPVSVEQAAQYSQGYLGKAGHPFPHCYACGPDRRADGLRLAPGPAGPGEVACTWTPPGAAGATVAAEVVWAALDCPSGWTADLRLRPGVLSRMTAELLGPVLTGRPHVIVARRGAQRGRVTANTSALYSEAGTLLARAATLWTVIDAS